jgi:F-type H+-transporting ATPase subunit b
MSEITTSLGFKLDIFIAQIVLFLALWFAMSTLFWKPVLAHMAGRDRDIDERYRQRENLQHEMEALRADYLARIAVVEAEARTHIQNAIKEAQAERERLLAAARTHAEETLKQGIADMEREKSEALRTLQDRMTGIAVGVADAALASTTDQAALQRAIEVGVARRANEAADFSH